MKGAAYCGTLTKVMLVCANGHLCEPRPASVLQGGGICLTCAGLDSRVAEQAFWRRVQELGATLAPSARYLNTSTPVHLVCAAGHQCSPLSLIHI